MQSPSHQPTSPGLNWVIATGIVGADIGTSVFYGTGVLFPIVGYWAPFFILFVCFMMWLFKKTYQEGLALSPYNGGSYSMVLRSLGRRAAVLVGAMTVISYLATATVSSLSGASYFLTLWGSPSEFNSSLKVLLSFFPLVLFGILNSRGIKEPAKLVTVITGIHFSLLGIMALWGLQFLAFNFSDIDFTKLQNLQLQNEVTFGLFVYGIAAAFLGITGFESAAQIVEELETPTLRTIHKLYKAVILLVSFTAPAISFLCLMILTPQEINGNLDSLLSALADKLGGKIFVTVIVVDATLTLFAATNTAFVGFIGLATTMAKQGNLPQFLLYRFEHLFSSIKGYPFIALPFMFIAMIMASFVAGELLIVAKVYEIAFIFVMVSFCLGVILMRNRNLRKNIDQEYLSRWLFKFQKFDIPVIPLVSGVVLLVANIVLFAHSSEAHLMLLSLLSAAVLVMAYYRWGVLEKRLTTHSDLRLGFGIYSTQRDLPSDLTKYVLCVGGVGARRLVNQAIEMLLGESKSQFELIVFHAEDDSETEQASFFFELIQRVVSQQIAPLYEKRGDFVLTVKALPGSLEEGLQALKSTTHIEQILFGMGRSLESTEKLAESIFSEIQIETRVISR